MKQNLPSSYAEFYIPVVSTEFKKVDDKTGDLTITITRTSGDYLGFGYPSGRRNSDKEIIVII